MLYITAILEDNTLIAEYDYDTNTWTVTISDKLTGNKAQKTLESDELAIILTLAVQNEQGIIPQNVIDDLYPVAENITSQFTDGAVGKHPLRIIP